MLKVVYDMVHETVYYKPLDGALIASHHRSPRLMLSQHSIIGTPSTLHIPRHNEPILNPIQHAVPSVLRHRSDEPRRAATVEVDIGDEGELGIELVLGGTRRLCGTMSAVVSERDITHDISLSSTPTCRGR